MTKPINVKKTVTSKKYAFRYLCVIHLFLGIMILPCKSLHEIFSIKNHEKSSFENYQMIELFKFTVYLNTEKYSNINIIHVDYEKLAQSGCYWTLVQSLSIIGKCTAEFIENEMTKNGIAISRFHPIGFSFGAHAAAVTAENIREIGIFKRLTGN